MYSLLALVMKRSSGTSTRIVPQIKAYIKLRHIINLRTPAQKSRSLLTNHIQQ